MSLTYDEHGEVVKPVFTSSFEYCQKCTRRLHKDLFDEHTTCRSCRGVYDIPNSTKDGGV